MPEESAERHRGRLMRQGGQHRGSVVGAAKSGIVIIFKLVGLGARSRQPGEGGCADQRSIVRRGTEHRRRGRDDINADETHGAP